MELSSGTTRPLQFGNPLLCFWRWLLPIHRETAQNRRQKGEPVGWPLDKAASISFQTSAADTERPWLSSPWRGGRSVQVFCNASLTCLLPGGFLQVVSRAFTSLSVHTLGRLSGNYCPLHTFLSGEMSCQSLWNACLLWEKRENFFWRKSHQCKENKQTNKQKPQIFPLDTSSLHRHSCCRQGYGPWGCSELQPSSLPAWDGLHRSLFLQEMRAREASWSFMEMASNVKSGFIWHFVQFSK